MFDVRNGDDEAIPLSVPVVAGNEWAYVKECLDAGFLAAGPMLGRFETALRELSGARHAIACSSGTAGLHVALLSVGVHPGDLVIVPTITFAATANAVAYVQAEPVFVGCDEFLNIDAEVVASFFRDECEAGPHGPVLHATGQRVAAMIPVHVFGNPCDMVTLLATAREHGVPVIEDAAESVGSRWTTGPLAGRHTGSVGDMGVFSFNGNKVVTCGGGGAILSSDDEMVARSRYLIDQAKDDSVRFVHNEVGYNYRLSAVAAAIGVAQLELLGQIVETKRRNARRYAERLSSLSGLTMLGVPKGTAPNHWFYALVVDPLEAGFDREQLMARLSEQGIQTRPLWYPSHLQRPFAGCRAYGVDRAVWYWERILNVPCSADLTPDAIDRVCDAIEMR